MTKVIIKHRLFTWFEKTPNLASPDGPDMLTERIAHLGEEIDIPEDNPHLARGRQPDIDAFYTDEEAEAIRNGTYSGPDLPHLQRMRSGQRPVGAIEPVEGEGFQVDGLSAEELAEYIEANKLTIPQTVALAGDTLESVEKVLDAENIATDNSPRKGVVEGLEAKMRAVTA